MPTKKKNTIDPTPLRFVLRVVVFWYDAPAKCKSSLTCMRSNVTSKEV